MKTPTTTDGYNVLVKKIQGELDTLDFLIKSRTAETYWKIGKYIHEELWKQKDRAGLGEKLCLKLSQDVNRDASTLWRMVQFYRVYPVLAARRELSWSHYKTLIAVKDKDERKKLEEEIIRKNWDTDKLQQFLNTKRQIEQIRTVDGPIPQLKLERGALYTYRIIEEPSLDSKSGKFVDCGFNRWADVSGASRFEKGDMVESLKDTHGNYSLKKAVGNGRDRSLLYTFKASVLRIVDGDTLWAIVDCGFSSWQRSEFRLRGIDCPEMDTEEGKRAKAFALSRLKACEFIVIKTYKGDKYGRYLADVFYQPSVIATPAFCPPRNLADSRGKQSVSGQWDPAKVASDGIFLNQELLDNRLAVSYKS